MPKCIEKRLILWITAFVCLGVLFFFKYFNFFSESLSALLKLFSIRLNQVTLKIILPVGISFYTFQTLSYVIDVYRGNIAAERHFGMFAAFISFFPQLVAGPIERTVNLLPQIKGNHQFDYKQATYGLKLMAWGYFKKIVIADTLSGYVKMVYDDPSGFTGFALILASLFFAIQIYCDFSGYSDIAIGSAKLLGINLMTNFKSPYFSKSIKEFWERWHISLSTWFRDYVYIPLGGNRVSKARHRINLLITFLISGLWHGANWTFILWGAIHGCAQIFENSIASVRKTKKAACPAPVKWIGVFLFCTFAWVFFVANSVSDGFYILSHMFVGILHPRTYILSGFINLEFSAIHLIVLTVSLIMLCVFDYFSLNYDVIEMISKKKTWVRWCVYALFLLWAYLALPITKNAEFIYFQF